MPGVVTRYAFPGYARCLGLGGRAVWACNQRCCIRSFRFNQDVRLPSRTAWAWGRDPGEHGFQAYGFAALDLQGLLVSI
jgi:hypothetical protein